MPPRKQKQTASASASTSSNGNTLSMAAPPTTLATKTGDEEKHTPERSPAKRGAMTITEAQKQALMDDLQLEVTDRARKLRAQYALQAQGLRSRLEMRVNRIPQALRKRNMQDLLDEHADRVKPRPTAPVSVVDSRENVLAPSSAMKSLKRTSEIFGSENKENTYAQAGLPNPKKRAKTATAAPTALAKPTQTASHNGTSTTVLSPKSHNSRVLPRAPLRPAMADKSSSRPTSPVKPTVTLADATKSNSSPRAPPRAPSRQTKRPATATGARTAALTGRSRDSEGSSTSAGTTIVSKPGAKKAAPARKAPVPAAARKRAATVVKKEPVASAPAPTGRTLRKRA